MGSSWRKSQEGSWKLSAKLDDNIQELSWYFSLSHSDTDWLTNHKITKQSLNLPAFSDDCSQQDHSSCLSLSVSVLQQRMESCSGTIPPRWGRMTLHVIATEVHRGAGGTLWSTLTSGGVITSRTMTSSSLLTLRVSGVRYLCEYDVDLKEWPRYFHSVLKQPEVTAKHLFLHRYNITDKNRSSHSASGVKSLQVRHWTRFSYLKSYITLVWAHVFIFFIKIKQMQRVELKMKTEDDCWDTIIHTHDLKDAKLFLVYNL